MCGSEYIYPLTPYATMSVALHLCAIYIDRYARMSTASNTHTYAYTSSGQLAFEMRYIPWIFKVEGDLTILMLARAILSGFSIPCLFILLNHPGPQARKATHERATVQIYIHKDSQQDPGVQI
jgi:hypothetical protein